ADGEPQDFRERDLACRQVRFAERGTEFARCRADVQVRGRDATARTGSMQVVGYDLGPPDIFDRVDVFRSEGHPIWSSIRSTVNDSHALGQPESKRLLPGHWEPGGIWRHDGVDEGRPTSAAEHLVLPGDT